jgi:hypothetical protein
MIALLWIGRNRLSAGAQVVFEDSLPKAASGPAKMLHHSILADDVGVPRGQKPFAVFPHPDICKTTINSFPCVWRGTFWHNSFTPH